MQIFYSKNQQLLDIDISLNRTGELAPRSKQFKRQCGGVFSLYSDQTDH